MWTHFNSVGIIVEKVLLSRRSLFKSQGNRWCSLMTFVMTSSINNLDAQCHLLKEGFIREWSKSGSCLILPSCLKTIEWSNSELKRSSFALRMHFSTWPFGSGKLMIWSFVGGMQVGAKCIFAWRALMLAAVGAGAGGAFLLDGLVAAAGSIFLWFCFITKFLCNLLLMSSTKLCNVWIGWASFGGEEGARSNYQKCATQLNTSDGLVGMSHAEQWYQI